MPCVQDEGQKRSPNQHGEGKGQYHCPGCNGYREGGEARLIATRAYAGVSSCSPAGKKTYDKADNQHRRDDAFERTDIHVWSGTRLVYVMFTSTVNIDQGDVQQFRPVA